MSSAFTCISTADRLERPERAPCADLPRRMQGSCWRILWKGGSPRRPKQYKPGRDEKGGRIARPGSCLLGRHWRGGLVCRPELKTALRKFGSAKKCDDNIIFPELRSRERWEGWAGALATPQHRRQAQKNGARRPRFPDWVGPERSDLILIEIRGWSGCRCPGRQRSRCRR